MATRIEAQGTVTGLGGGIGAGVGGSIAPAGIEPQFELKTEPPSPLFSARFVGGSTPAVVHFSRETPLFIDTFATSPIACF